MYEKQDHGLSCNEIALNAARIKSIFEYTIRCQQIFELNLRYTGKWIQNGGINLEDLGLR